jgi:hypothetical protein
VSRHRSMKHRDLRTSEVTNKSISTHPVWDKRFFYLTLIEFFNLRDVPVLRRLCKSSSDSVPTKKKIQEQLKYEMLMQYSFIEKRYRLNLINYQSMEMYVSKMDMREMLSLFAHNYITVQNKQRLVVFSKLLQTLLRYLSFYSVDDLKNYHVSGRGSLADVFIHVTDFIYFNFDSEQIQRLKPLVHKIFMLLPVYSIASGLTEVKYKKLLWLVTSQFRRAKLPSLLSYVRSCIEYHNCQWREATIQLTSMELMIFYQAVVHHRCRRSRRYVYDAMKSLVSMIPELEKWNLLRSSLEQGAVYLLPLWFQPMSNELINKAIVAVRETLFTLFSKPYIVRKHYSDENINALVNFLQLHHFDWSCSNYCGNTLLYLSALHRYEAFTEALLRARIDCLDQCNNYGVSPRMWLNHSELSFSSKSRKHRKFVKQLILQHDIKQENAVAKTLLSLSY